MRVVLQNKGGMMSEIEQDRCTTIIGQKGN